jgi:hypothetical protein
MSSRSYQLFEQAMRLRKQIVCTYDGHTREICPIILGHSEGQEKALTYQFAGQSKSGLPLGGEWRWSATSNFVMARGSRVQPHAAAGLRRNCRSRCESGESLRAEKNSRSYL